MALSIFKPFRGKDYRFIDKIVRQQFQIGGTLLLVHKYLGPEYAGNISDKTQPVSQDINELTIQDVLFLENRDRNYDKNLIELKGHYTVDDMEFNLSQFGLMLAGNSIYISVHINEMVDRIGRKLMAGDVIELIHRRDDLLLDENLPALNAFYVVKDAARAAEGYSATWYPHIWRIRVEPLKDSQEYKDILDREEDENVKLRDILSTFNKQTEINELISEQANIEVDRRNFDSSHFYIKSNSNIPTSNLLPWVFNGDGIPPNQNDIVSSGRRFPTSPSDGDYFLRTDYKPARLFQRQNNKWQAIEDNWRMQYQDAHRILVDHLDDSNIVDFGTKPEDKIPERQPLSSVIPNRGSIPPINEVTEVINDQNEEN